MRRDPSAPARVWGLLGLLAAASCATTARAWRPPTALDSGDVPAALKPGYGNRELHTWWPLTPAEVTALRGIDAARQGDAHALLALAIVASGDQRDAGTYAADQQRVDQFLADVKPALAAAPDAWHRGYELHRAMHRVFFNAKGGELDGYELSQSRVTAIFTGGHYNCLSSAMLFAVLARGAGLSVRAALVPTHVFIELSAPGAKLIEVETTSATGFDWVHDARFYKEADAQWSASRGLRPVTLDEYQHRTILEPYQLMANGMRNPHPGQTDVDRNRLYELAALVDPDNPELELGRMQVYVNEAHELYQAKAWRTMVQLFDAVAPAVSDVGTRSRDPKTLELVSWAKWHYAYALAIAGRQDEATALMEEGFAHLDPGWGDAAALRNNYLSLLNDLLGALVTKQDYAGALKEAAAHREVCRANEACAGNMGVIYGNWSIQYQNAGDWPSARKVLQDCLADLPNETRCRDALADLESRHQF